MIMAKMRCLAVLLCLSPFLSAAAGEAGKNPLYQNPGMEIADFVAAATKDRAAHDKILMEKGGAASLESLMVMAMVAMYDTVDNARGKNPADKRQGKTRFMMLADVDAVREKKGDVITFSGKKVHDKQDAIRKKGDVWTQSGSLDMAKGVLTVETRVESGGKVVDRYVFEMAALPKGVWLTQFLHVKDDDRFSRDKGPQLAGFFSRFDVKEYRHAVAKAASQTDFTFSPLAGKGDVAPETLAAAYQISEIAGIKDGAFALETPKK